jgi:hypothetical protein
MIRSLLLVTALLAGAAVHAASPSQIAAGIHLGTAQNGSNFSGLELRIGQDESLDMILSYNNGAGLIFNGNYLHHLAPVLRQIPVKGIVPYVGVGGGIWTSGGAWVQVPLGIDLRFDNPIETGMYIAPGIDLLGDTRINMHVGLAVRYWL